MGEMTLAAQVGALGDAERDQTQAWVRMLQLEETGRVLRQRYFMALLTRAEFFAMHEAVEAEWRSMQAEWSDAKLRCKAMARSLDRMVTT